METFSATSSPSLTACFAVSTVIVAALSLSAPAAIAGVIAIVSTTATERSTDNQRFAFFMFFCSFLL